MDAHVAQLRADRKLVMELALELAPPPKENLVHQTQKLVPDSSRVPAELKFSLGAYLFKSIIDAIYISTAPADHDVADTQACSKWVSRGIRDRYFFVGIIDRAAWDIARDNDQAAGPVRILHGIMTRPQARLDTARDTYCK